MRKVHETTCKNSGISWTKCLHFRRQGTKGAQTKGGGDEDVTKLSVHGQNVFQKCYSTDLTQIGLHTSSGNLEKEAHSTIS